MDALICVVLVRTSFFCDGYLHVSGMNALLGPADVVDLVAGSAWCSSCLVCFFGLAQLCSVLRLSAALVCYCRLLGPGVVEFGLAQL